MRCAIASLAVLLLGTTLPLRPAFSLQFEQVEVSALGSTLIEVLRQVA